MLRKPVLGLVTSLHWFGEDRQKAVNTLYASHFGHGPLSPASFSGILKHCQQPPQGNREVLKLLSPDQFEVLFPKFSASDEKLKDWRFQETIIEAGPVGQSPSDPLMQAERERDTRPFLGRAINSRGMLLYWQRSLLSSQFNDFDPSRIEIQDGKKNRPWDYDHILPSAVLNSNQGRFREACRQWSNTIGNLRAWPLERNRSRRDDYANVSIFPKHFADDGILNQEECNAFSLTRTDVNEPQRAAEFMNAARARFLRIYSNWFNSLDIGKLLSIQNGP